jgi:hypothetical protein
MNNAPTPLTADMPLEEIERIEAERFRTQLGHQERAAAEPLPGPLAQAFAGGPLTHAGVTLRPMVASDIVILKQLRSPLYLRLIEHAKAEEERKGIEFTDEEGFEMIYQFAVPLRQVRDELAKGREFFRSQAVERIGDQVNPADLKLLSELVVLNLANAFSTAVNYGNKTTGEGESFFTKPPAPLKTDSAGGSVTSAS